MEIEPRPAGGERQSGTLHHWVVVEDFDRITSVGVKKSINYIIDNN